MTPIGVFDSGYGGLTILKDIRRRLPQYDYLYLGDNARAPYGTRSFDLVYHFTLQAVEELFSRGCPLVILACNTASAKALRTIQQHDLPRLGNDRRVLGVIRPTVEALGNISESGHVGILATPGTIASGSYAMEMAKLHPEYTVTGHACPLWVPLVESGEERSEGASWFVRNDIDALMRKDPEIDSIVLGCTHYPLLLPQIKANKPDDVTIVTQGDIVAQSLADYLRRHPDMEQRLSRNTTLEVLTTEEPARFNPLASRFLGSPVKAHRIELSPGA